MPESGIRRINAGKNHYYKIDGHKADGVTTLLGKGMPKPALAYWSARCVAEFVADATEDHLWALKQSGRNSFVDHLKKVPWDQRDQAAVRGTDVHALAEQLIHGAEVSVPDHLAGHVESAVRFMDEWRVTPVLVERVVGCRKWLYAGTFDLIADLPDGRRVLFDYKTSRSGIFAETAMQLAAYRWADCYVGTDDQTEVPMGEVGIDESKAVWLRADGYDVIPLNTDLQVFNTFLHVAHVARSIEPMKSWLSAAEMPRG